jgi:diaminopropionate ammonia-lyase
MFKRTEMQGYRTLLDLQDAETLRVERAMEIAPGLTLRDDNPQSLLHVLPGPATKLGIASRHLKGGVRRLGLGGFEVSGGIDT